MPWACRPIACIVVRQGIDRELFHAGDQKKAREYLGIPASGNVLLFVGNLLPVKAVNVLIQALSQLAGMKVSFHLYILGEGPLRGTLETLMKDLGLSQSVTIKGPVSHNELGNWYRAATLTVLSSHSEGIPNVLRESLACGTPFVATDVGGIKEISVAGMSRLVPAGNPAAFAQALAEELGRPHEHKAIPFPTWMDHLRNI